MVVKEAMLFFCPRGSHSIFFVQKDAMVTIFSPKEDPGNSFSAPKKNMITFVAPKGGHNSIFFLFFFVVVFLSHY